MIAAFGQYGTVDAHLGTLRIRLCVKEVGEVYCCPVRIERLVGHINLEAGGLVERHIAHRGIVGPDAQIVDRYRALIKNGARTVELRDTLVFVRCSGDTATRPIDEVPIFGCRTLEVA